MTWDLTGPGEGSSWGLPGELPIEEGLGTAESARYAPVGRVGSGGMGVVEAVYDARLHREVACKRPAPGLAPELAIALLAHEARITARLDHPNIVALHDAGLDGSGRPYFTMPLLRGVTLADHIAAPITPASLPRLVRHLLDASRGVAHAHERGIVHADLKPANVLVGPQGETWVADWGLAHRIGGDGPPVALGAGTPPWTAPEVHAGAVPTRASDVYALGVMLGQILAAADPQQAAADLRAVQRQASPIDPTERYPHAAGVAAELERWLDGRPVLAHPYTTAEIARRLISAWRVPLAVGAVATVALLTMGIVTSARTAAERDRAVDAEARLTRTAASLWSDRAVAALADDDDFAAAEAARAALALQPSPRALGVLTALGSSRPGAAAPVPLPPCSRFVRLLEDGLLCGDGVDLLRVDDAGHLVDRWPIAATDAAEAGPGALWVVERGGVSRLDLATGTSTRTHADGAENGLVGGEIGFHLDRLRVIEIGQPVTRHAPCSDRDNIDAVAAVPGVGWWVVCSYGLVVHAPAGGTPAPLRDGGPDLAGVVALDVAADASVMVAGTLRGEVVALDPRSGNELGRVAAGTGPLRKVRIAPDGRLVAAMGADGRVRLLRPADGARLDALSVQGVRDLRWEHTGSVQELRLVTDTAIWRVPLPAPPPVRQWKEAGGISALALSDDGARIAVAAGPNIVLRDLHTGVRLGGHDEHQRVVKGLAFVGDELVSGAVDDLGSLRWYDPASQEQLAHDLGPMRRIARTGDGHLLAMSYGGTLQITSPGERSPEAMILEHPVVELVAAAGSIAWGLDDVGRLLRVEPRTRSVVTASAAKEHAPDRRLALSADGRWLARSNAHDVRVGLVDDLTHTVQVSDRDATALALDAQGHLLAIGLQDGEVEVWSTRTGEVVWTAPGHEGRVSALAFTPDHTLISAGWDGRVRLWSSDEIVVDASTGP